MSRNATRHVKLLITTLLLVCVTGALGAADELDPAATLETAFQDPPSAARPWAYWWWLDGHASRAGITRDLEEMQRQGIAGVLVFDAGDGKGAPAGPRFMSEEWRALFAYAVSEAGRLGIRVSLNLCSGWDCGGTWVQAKDAAQKVVYAEQWVTGPDELRLPLPVPPTVDNYYRDIAILAYRPISRTGAGADAAANDSTAGKQPGGRSRILHWEVKSGNRGLRSLPLGIQYEQAQPEKEDADCLSEALVDLSRNIDQEGRLRWKVPEGTWCILRFGSTLLGAKTKLASPGSQGYEIDFLSAAALDMHFSETAEKVLQDIGPAATRTLKYFHDDSWEIGNPTWTPKFREEFRKRRGYDLLPYLPVLAGKIVDSREISNRFLWDVRRTIADCIAENHYGRLAQLSRQHALGTHPEAGGPFFPHIDALMNLGRSDVPMGEFWARKTEPGGLVVWADHYPLCDTVRQAASAAHIYGKKLVQAEAFTTMGPNWEKDPFMLKDIGDRAFCQGLTRNVLCFYVHQPNLDIKPGYQWEAAGTHFDRNITWWNQMRAWTDYLARCQFLLQQGLFVADACYFYGEDVPGFVPARSMMQPPLPRGYDCDTTNAEALLERILVENGRVLLPDRTSYRLLVLPPRRAMGEAVLARVAQLVAQGAIVVGPKPDRATGLHDYPDCDRKVRQLADQVWGDCDGTSVTEHSFGKGKVIWGPSLADILQEHGTPPDFAYSASSDDPHLEYIHRRLPDADIYFVSNQRNRFEQLQCSFRVTGRAPELWLPDSGDIHRQLLYVQRDAYTTLPLRFDPRGSVFVVFRDANRPNHVTSLALDGQSLFPAGPWPAGEWPLCECVTGDAGAVVLRAWRAGDFACTPERGDAAHVRISNIPAPLEVSGPWTVRFPPGWGAPASVVFDQLTSWTARPETGIKYFSGTAAYERQFDLPRELLRSDLSLYLDLGHVKNTAEITLNGRPLGVLWKPPFRVDVSRLVRATGNQLEIRVTNLWPNRLIGDQWLPESERFTHTNVKKFHRDSPLLESGLLGPVRIHAARDVPVRIEP